MAARKIKTTTYLIYAIVSACLLFLCISTLMFYPLFSTVNTKTISNLDETLNSSPGNFADFKVDTLYYTGFDYTHNKHTKGHYYYTVSNNKCYYFLLSADTIKNFKSNSEKTPHIINNHSVYGKIITNNDLITNLNMSFSKQINWTEYDLEKMCCPYIISELSITKHNFLISVLLIIFTVSSFTLTLIYFYNYYKRKKLTI